jgi:hypothetical protein
VAAVAVLALAGMAVLRTAGPDQPWRGAVVMTGVALAVTTPWITWYSMLLVALVAMDGRAEWLALAAARYLTPLHPLPHFTIAEPSRVGYGGLTLYGFVPAVRCDRWPVRPRPPRFARLARCPVGGRPASTSRRRWSRSGRQR